MKFFRTGQVLFLIVMFISVSLAAETSIEEIMSKLSGQRDQIKSYTAEVITSVEGAFLPTKKVQHGKIYFQAPENIRTEINEPAKSIVLKTAEKSFVIDQHGNSKEIEQDENNVIEEIKDPLKLFDKFNFTISESDSETLKLVGIPRSNRTDDPFSRKVISKIVFYMDKENYFSKEIRVHKADGQELARIITSYKKINEVNFPYKTETIVSFSGKQMRIEVLLQNIVLNQELPAQIFDLEQIKKELKAKE